MVYVPPEYPGDIPEFAEVWPPVDDVNWMYTSAWDALVKEVRAIMAELGTDPAGASATVKARLDAMLPHFHNRGDPAAYDFTVGNFTTDGAWRDLDLSAIVPAGAKVVLINITVRDNLIEVVFAARRNGNTNAVNMSKIYTQVANLLHSIDMVVACDDNRIIEYQASNTVWTTINLVIKGWWK